MEQSGTIVPDDPDADPLVWDIPGHPTLQPQERVTLEFTANIPLVPGTYCNEAEAAPGQQHQSSGHTAIVNIGVTNGLCPEKAVKVTQETDFVRNQNETCAEPPLDCLTGLFHIDYTIRVGNLGNQLLTIKTIEDQLPISYQYDRTLCPLLDDLCIDETPDLPPETKNDERDLIIRKNLSLDLEGGPDKAMVVKFRVWSDWAGFGNLFVDAFVTFEGGRFFGFSGRLFLSHC